MANKWAYDMDDKELVEAFMRACGKAATSNSGLVIDFSAGPQLAEAHYLKGAVLARFAGIKPPYKPGQELKPRPAFHDSVISKNYDLSTYAYLKIGFKDELKICQVHYVDGEWQLSFDSHPSYRFSADRFMLKAETAVQPA